MILIGAEGQQIEQEEEEAEEEEEEGP